MVSHSHIYFQEHCYVVQLIEEIIDPGKGILILDRHFIQLPVVNAKPHSTVLLLHKED